MKLYNLVDFRQLRQCDTLTDRTRLFIGYLCNIKCRFCFYKNTPHVDIRDKIYQQLDWGKAYGIKDWDISGGEPPLLSYWFQLLEDMKQMGFRNIACITNGYKFADIEFLKESMDCGLNELLFSLHGKDPESHDKMTRVRGSHKKISHAIMNAMYEGIKIRINVVVARDNYTDLPAIAEQANRIEPVAFNFLPFRLENSASKENSLKFSQAMPYIKEAIDILDKGIKIRVRYVPFCVMQGYEEYVAMYLQRMFDEYEWSEYTVRKFEHVRFNRDVSELDCTEDKWELEIDAIHKSIKHVANHSFTCLNCKYLHICEGIWKSYSRVWGIDEFEPIHGEKIKSIMRRENNGIVKAVS
ncbi:MAG: radical SAM protein [Candidatus Heimdallarchaeota archaeon]|nr:radical SAM protein [Candidatus Heimdallarchaeota archaeon]